MNKHVKKLKHHTHSSSSHNNHKTARGKIVHRLYSNKFCPKCGKQLTGNSVLCNNCQIVDFDFKDISILLCNNCKSYNFHNKWSKFKDLNIAIKKVTMNCVKHKCSVNKISNNEYEKIVSYKAGVDKEHSVDIKVNGQIFSIPINVKITLCPKCCKSGTQYFESIIQLRNTTNEINEFVKNEILKQKHKGVHLNKESRIGEDIDYYITDQSYAKTLAEKLRKNFGAVIKKNAQHFSVDWTTSKTIYRLNILIQFPKYKKDDVIKFDGNLFKIVSMDSKIHVCNIRTSHKTSMPHKESYDVLKPVIMMLIKKHPEYEVLDPQTYYQARLMNPSDTLQINQKIRVIVDGGQAWMVKE